MTNHWVPSHLAWTLGLTKSVVAGCGHRIRDAQKVASAARPPYPVDCAGCINAMRKKNLL